MVVVKVVVAVVIIFRLAEKRMVIIFEGMVTNRDIDKVMMEALYVIMTKTSRSGLTQAQA